MAAKQADPVLEALDGLVEAIRENMARNERVLARAEQLREMRRSGLSWTETVSEESRPLIVELIGENLDRLFDAGSRFRRAEAKALHDEGLTMERIADLFGVTRQRVSALLRPPSRSRGGGE